jgi:hypothetical protein
MTPPFATAAFPLLPWLGGASLPPVLGAAPELAFAPELVFPAGLVFAPELVFAAGLVFAPEAVWPAGAAPLLATGAPDVLPLLGVGVP